MGNIPFHKGNELACDVMAIRGKTFHNYTNRVVHVLTLKLFSKIVSFIYVKTNLYFWSRSYSKQPLLREKTYATVFFP